MVQVAVKALLPESVSLLDGVGERVCDPVSELLFALENVVLLEAVCPREGVKDRDLLLVGTDVVLGCLVCVIESSAVFELDLLSDPLGLRVMLRACDFDPEKDSVSVITRLGVVVNSLEREVVRVSVPELLCPAERDTVRNLD